ncbi:MAG TPA: hypothetical protein VNI84_13650 [Pyrinomonadaceae bacterium]|nr:hypothetical protein [Pyrinomonadaceae bacterium]
MLKTRILKTKKNWRVSEAYVVLIKERAKARGELYEAEQTRSPETPRVKTAVRRVALFNREIKKLSKTDSGNASKFSAAYGDLILAKIQTEAELFELRQKFTPEYVAVKKKEVELASLNSDLKQINKNFR